MNNMLKHIMEEEESRRAEEISEQERLEEIQNLKIRPDSQASFGFVENNKERVFFLRGQSMQVPIRAEPPKESPSFR